MSNLKTSVLGVILVISGIVSALVGLKILNNSSLLFIAAGGFLAPYFVYKKSLGLLITGCVITAISANVTLDPAVINYNSCMSVMILGCAFLLVFAIHTFNIKSNDTYERYWPFFLAVVLFALGGFGISLQKEFYKIDPLYFNLTLPVIVLILGIVIAVVSVKPPKVKEALSESSAKEQAKLQSEPQEQSEEN